MIRRNISMKSFTLLNVGVGLFFVMVAVSLVLIVNQSMRQQALIEAEAKARILLDRNLATHTYFSKILKPNLFEWTEPFRSAQYFDPSWMSSTYAVREIDQFFQEFSSAHYYVKDAAINARSPENEADEFEKGYLLAIRANPKLLAKSSVREIDGQPYFVVLRPGEVLESSCLRCHSDPAVAPAGLVEIYGAERSFHRESELNTVVSAISIRIPLAEAYNQADSFSLQLSGLLLALLTGLFVAYLWLQRRLIIAPLETIRKKAQEISNDPAHLGEVIAEPFGRDLRELVQVFNQMSIQLRQHRDHLEEQVSARTADLAATNTELAREISERKQAQVSLQMHSEQLEETIAARTRELMTAQEQLLRRERLAVLGQLAGGVGHELRRPLSIISNAVYYLNMIQPEAEEKVREYLGIIDRETQNAEKIITDLLDFTRIKAVSREPVDVSRLVFSTLERYPAPAEVYIDVNLAERLPSVFVDPRQAEQVLGNLVQNAYQAMPAGGKLAISAGLKSEAGQDYVSLSVQDSGVGISPENLSKVFEPLFTTKPQGIGLGLAVSKVLMEANGGRIEVVSEPGVGSRFTLLVPVYHQGVDNER